MFKVGSLASICFNGFLAVIWLLSVALHMVRNDYSALLYVGVFSMICYGVSSVVNYMVRKGFIAVE